MTVGTMCLERTVTRNLRDFALQTSSGHCELIANKQSLGSSVEIMAFLIRDFSDIKSKHYPGVDYGPPHI